MTQTPPPVDAEPPTAPVPESDRLAPRVIVLWTLGALVQALLLGAAGVAALETYVRPKHPQWIEAGWRLLWILLAAAVVWAAAGPIWAWFRWRFWVGPALLVMRHGILFEEEKAIPVSRMQHVDLTRGPIERLFGLATLVVHTAGTEGAVLRLPGLEYERACRLRDRILASRGADVV
jgi:membrane protein YdbS with pleckstrin-like domain